MGIIQPDQFISHEHDPEFLDNKTIQSQETQTDSKPEEEQKKVKFNEEKKRDSSKKLPQIKRELSEEMKNAKKQQRSFIIPMTTNFDKLSAMKLQSETILEESEPLVNPRNEDRKRSYDYEQLTYHNHNEFEKFFYEEQDKSRKMSLDEFKTKSEIEEIGEITLTNKELDISSIGSQICSNIEYELKLFKKGETIRRSYISKLIQTNTWQPNKKEKKHNTMIIFDWDDTLLCTSFLTPTGVFYEDFELGEKDLLKIKKLETYVVKILNLAIDKGDTYIITNAAPGWVEYSSERFYPDTVELLKKVTIVSARGEYEKLYPGDSRQWKIQAFLEMKKNFDSNLVANIICLGDSIIEMEAAHVLASKFSQAFIKTIKFREGPKPEELIKQLGLVVEQFPTIYSSIKNLTIRVERKGK